MLLARENGSITVFTDTYCLRFAKDRPFVSLDDQNGDRVADLFVLAGVHSMNGRDDTTAFGTWMVEESFDEIIVALEASSAAWQKKIIRFRCQPRRLAYEVDVFGEGQLAETTYFGGYSSAQNRWGSGFFWSGQRYQSGFNPEPTVDEVYTFPAESTSVINMTGVPLPGKADWFFTPPPFCFGFQTQSGWMSIGIEARPGRNRFNDFTYHGSRSAFYLSMSYEGQTQVSGQYCLPAVVFEFGPDPYTLIASHVQHLRSAGLVPQPAVVSHPTWWYEPMFCGWGSQCYLANIGGGKAPDYATQASYEAFLHTLSLRGLTPGTIILDDKWQKTYGNNDVDTDKWPDLRGFIRCRHEEGQHVLLWLKAWDPEGVPIEECITNAGGLPIAIDPTNPAFESRLRQSIRRMLSTEGYDADGFKIDFSARIPSGYGINTWGSEWGLELMRKYLSIIYDEAKQAKPDAFVITHTPHPYLADLVDAIRLNDINTNSDVCRQMTHRATIAAIACPEALIDSDNWPIANKESWRAYLSLKPYLGIPALYYATHIDSTGEPLTEDDYAQIREVWAEYRAAAASNAHHSDEKINELGGAYAPGTNHLVKKLSLIHTLPVATKPLKGWDEPVLHGLS